MDSPFSSFKSAILLVSNFSKIGPLRISFMIIFTFGEKVVNAESSVSAVTENRAWKNFDRFLTLFLLVSSLFNKCRLTRNPSVYMQSFFKLRSLSSSSSCRCSKNSSASSCTAAAKNSSFKRLDIIGYLFLQWEMWWFVTEFQFLPTSRFWPSKW